MSSFIRLEWKKINISDYKKGLQFPRNINEFLRPSLVFGVSLTTPEKMLMSNRNTVTRRAVLWIIFGNGAFRETYSYIIHKTIYNKQYTSQLLSCRRPCGIRCGREEEKDPGGDHDEAGGDVVEEDVPVQFSSRWWAWKMLDNLASGHSIFHLVHFIWNFSSKPTTE